MKYIIKKTETKSLREYRSTPNADFNNCPKDDIRISLIDEQKGLCAYCMSRISNEWNPELGKYKTEIEHYKSQDTFNGENGSEDLRLIYSNMLGVCNGNAGNQQHKLHCDKSKDLAKNKQFLPLTINPLNLNCEQLIYFTKYGEITSDNPLIKRDLDVLNLNEPDLVKKRKTIIDSIFTNLKNAHHKQVKNQKEKQAEWKIKSIKNELKKWEKLTGNLYEEYCQVAIYHLNKELKRYTNN